MVQLLIVVKIAKGKKEAITDGTFVILEDHGVPALLPVIDEVKGKKKERGSNGPNGVLIAFGSKYGTQRINLFDTDDATTMALLHDYIKFRDASKRAIFNQTVKQMVSTTRLQPKEYKTSVEVLQRFQDLSNAEFEASIGVVSFCQTWAANDKAGEPQFSVASPHFQTRFFIKSLDHIKITDSEAHAYKFTIEAFDAHMQSTKLDYTKKFVHLDNLYQKLLKSDLEALGHPKGLFINIASTKGANVENSEYWRQYYDEEPEDLLFLNKTMHRVIMGKFKHYIKKSYDQSRSDKDDVWDSTTNQLQKSNPKNWQVEVEHWEEYGQHLLSHSIGQYWYVYITTKNAMFNTT